MSRTAALFAVLLVITGARPAPAFEPEGVLPTEASGPLSGAHALAPDSVARRPAPAGEDPAPPPDELVAQALEHAPAVAALAARVQQAREMVRPAGALPNPMVELMIQDVGFPRWTVGTEEMSMAGPQLTQGIPFPGKRGERRRAAKAELAVKADELELLRREVTRDIRSLYARLYALDQERQALASGRELLEMLAATVRERYGVGLAEQEAAVKAQLAVSRLEERQDDLTAERAGLAAAVNRLLDRPGDAALGRVASLPEPQFPAPPWEPVVLQNSAGIAVRRAAVEAAERKLKVARMELRPDLVAGAGVGFRGGRDPVATFRLGVELPLWAAGNQLPMIRAAGQELEAARQDLREAEAGGGPRRPGWRRTGAGRAARCRATRRPSCRRPAWPSTRRVPATWPGGAISRRSSRTSTCGSRPAPGWPGARPNASRRGPNCRPSSARAAPPPGRRSEEETMIDLRGDVRRSLPLLVLLACGMLAFGALVAGCGRPAATGRTAGGQRQQYHCPMHPTYVSDRPGDCPICGMKLVPIEAKKPNGAGGPPAAAGATTASAGPRRILHYRNPMNPAVTSPVPMKDEMGMDYVPVTSDQVSVAGSVEGHASVEVSPDELKLAGLQSIVARRGRLAHTIRTVGEVKADETRISQVHTKISGWVEKLFVSSSGQAVRRGQPLLSIYSPELLATQQEFLRARESAARFTGSDLPEVRRGGEELLAAARQRLALFDVPQSFVETLESTGKPQRTVTLDAPASGFVTGKEVFAGTQIEPGMTLFTVTDLSKVWIEAEVYEYEAPLVRTGQQARVTLAYDPARVYVGRVSYIYPYLNPDTRTLRIRFEFDNPGLALKPGMYANVELDAQAVAGILIPDASILDTGPRQIVYVKTGEGRYEPRQVKVGIRSDGQAQILSGVKEGDEVVDRANFLLDSESRLRAAIGKAPGAHTAGAGAR